MCVRTLTAHLVQLHISSFPAILRFFRAFLYRAPFPGKQHVVFGYSCVTLTCVTTHTLRNISIDPRDIPFAIAKNNSLLHR